MEYIMTINQAREIISKLNRLLGIKEKSITKPSEIMTVDEACSRWGIHRTTLSRLIQTGDVKVFHIGTRIRIPLEENGVIDNDRIRHHKVANR